MDPPGTVIECIEPANTLCGDLKDMPFGSFIQDPMLGVQCSKGKESKKAYTEECRFYCKGGVLTPTMTDTVEICDVKSLGWTLLKIIHESSYFFPDYENWLEKLFSNFKCPKNI